MTTTVPATKRPNPAAIAIGIIVAIAAVLLAGAGVYTDLLWFGQIGYSEVFTTQIYAQGAVFIVAAVAFGGLTGLSFNIAYRNRPIYLKFPDERDPFPFGATA